MWWIVAVVSAVVLIATYVTWTAGRVDRLHARAAAAHAALDAHLLRRALAAVALAEAAQLPDLMYTARIALDVPAEDREVAENDLTRRLAEVVKADDPGSAAVIAANRRVALARQVHTDVVRDALEVRRRPLVRLLRLARRHPQPGYFDIEDPALEVRLVAPRQATPEPVPQPVPEPVVVPPAAQVQPNG